MPDELPNQPDPNLTQPAVTPTTPELSQATDTGLTPNLAATLASLPLIGGLFLLLEKQNRFVRFYAMQSLVFGGAWVVLSIGVRVLMFIMGPLGFLLGILYFFVDLALIGLWIFTAIQAFNGKEWEIPAVGKIARQQLARLTV